MDRNCPSGALVAEVRTATSDFSRPLLTPLRSRPLASEASSEKGSRQAQDDGRDDAGEPEELHGSGNDLMDDPEPPVEGPAQKDRYRQGPGGSGVAGRSRWPAKGHDCSPGKKGSRDEACGENPKVGPLVDHRPTMPVLLDDHCGDRDGKHQQDRPGDIRPAWESRCPHTRKG